MEIPKSEWVPEIDVLLQPAPTALPDTCFHVLSEECCQPAPYIYIHFYLALQRRPCDQSTVHVVFRL